MANEVNNETEESSQNETPVSEQANTNPSGEPATEETPVSAETNTNASDEPATTETPIMQDTSETASDDSAVAESPAATTQETTAPAATETPAATQDASASETPEQSISVEPSNSTEEDFGSILEKFEQEQTVFHSGELVEGTVVGVSERGVLIDFGHKSEGIAPIEDFTSPEGEVNVAKGDSVEVIIRSITSGDAPPMLSRADAKSRKSWDTIEKAFNDETPINARAVEVTKGGLRLDIDGVEAFMPGSQVDSRPIRNLNSFVGQDLEAKVIKFSRKRNNIVLSRKVLTDEVVNKQKAETLSQIEEGYIIEGTIKNITEYGAFVDIGGIDGLLHVTDMSWGRLQNPGDQFKVNDTVQVKVLKLDREKDKVALGYKQLIPDPWSTVMELYPINSKITGRISSVTDYGAFVALEPGVEGLVHVSEMSWSKRSQSPKKLVNSGDEVEVQILGIDTDDRRISLGMKQLQPNPWQTVHERYNVGQTVRGKVRNLTDFGAFIEIEDGIDGLVHVSDISHSKKIKHPKDALKRDQEVEAVIRSIDTNNRRMSLSIKELTPSVWESFITSHKPGDVVRGKISRFTGFGVFVELGNELEGLCHISELSDERIDRPEDIGAVGQEMDFKILRIESDTQKIGLSARAVGKEDEPVIDTKSYSTEAKGGMASLGELMNLRRGGAEDEVKEDQPKMSKKERKALQAQERAEKELTDAAAAAQTEAATDASAETENSETAETPAAATDDNQSAENTDSESGASEEPTVADNTESATGANDEQPAGETEPAAEPVAEESGETSADQPAVEATTDDQTETSETGNESGETEAEPKAASAETTEEIATADSNKAESATETDSSNESADNENDILELPGMDDQANTPVTESGETENAPKDAAENKADDSKASDDTEEKTANG